MCIEPFPKELFPLIVKKCGLSYATLESRLGDHDGRCYHGDRPVDFGTAQPSEDVSDGIDQRRTADRRARQVVDCVRTLVESRSVGEGSAPEQ